MIVLITILIDIIVRFESSWKYKGARRINRYSVLMSPLCPYGLLQIKTHILYKSNCNTFVYYEGIKKISWWLKMQSSSLTSAFY